MTKPLCHALLAIGFAIVLIGLARTTGWMVWHY